MFNYVESIHLFGIIDILHYQLVLFKKLNSSLYIETMFTYPGSNFPLFIY